MKSRKTKPVPCLPEQVIKNNIDFLSYLKQSAFHGDHPGIDKMVKEMRADLKHRKP